MREKQTQRFKRFTKRLEATFSAGNFSFRGISSNLSENGLFIRTQHGLTPGSIVDIEIFLPGGIQSRLKGRVMRTVKTSLSMMKNGMGIELIEKDRHYLDFVKTFYSEDDGKQEYENEIWNSAQAKTPPPEFLIVACPGCKVKNRIPREKLLYGAKCGRCGTILDIGDTT